MPENNEKKLRSQDWWAGNDEYYNFARRAWMRAEGFAPDAFQGKPVIGICNSWSELNNCNAHLRTVAEAVKRGVWTAGGFPLEVPTISLGELMIKPHRHALSEPHGHGRRRNDPRQSARRCRVALRLR
jgi:L-arabonate dehydrase